MDLTAKQKRHPAGDVFVLFVVQCGKALIFDAFCKISNRRKTSANIS